MGIIRNLPRELFDVTVFFYFKPSDDLGNFIWDSDNTNIVLPDTTIFERRRIIEEQKLNILVYCDIGMAPDTYFLSYSRLAPIQCNTWGHSDTSGIDTIDYYISSKYYEKDNHPEDNYSEKLVLLNSLCIFYYKIIENPELAEKHQFGFSSKVNIYLSSQVLFKLNPDFDKVLNNILEKDKDGIIVLIKMNLGLYIQDTLIKRLEQTLGSNMTRVHFIEWQKKSERDFYKLLSIADVIIDPYPFGGCNTSFSAFSMGIPIVTMPANFINGRFTHGLYRKMNILDLVANNNEEYVSLAVKCATDKTFRKQISTKILDNIHLIFNEIDSVNTWINFCIKAVTTQFTTNPIFIDNNDLSNNNKNNNNKLIEENKSNTSSSLDISNNIIPKIIHFIHFGFTDFVFIHYLAIKTAHINNPDYKIYLYYCKEPVDNIYWNYIKEFCTLVYTEPPTEIFNNKLTRYAHKADIIRLQKLLEHGGIYLDIDVLTNKSFDDLLNTDKTCVMGLQATNTQFQGLCNAVIFAKPKSKFLQIWYDEYKNFDNSQWDYHSVHLPLLLASQYSDLIDIKSQEAFFPCSWFDFDVLFTKNNNFTKLDNSYTLHLWETHLMDNLLKYIDYSYLNIYDTPFSNIYRKYTINPNKSQILFILQNNNLNFINIFKKYIYSFISNENTIYIKYSSDILNETTNNDLLQNTDDFNILLNTLNSKKYNISDITHVVFFTESKLWYLANNFTNLNSNIKSLSYIDSINTIKDIHMSYINNFITSSKSDLEVFNKYKSTYYIPFNLMKYTSLISNNNQNIYETFYNNHNNEAIIKLNNSIHIENYNTIPLSNTKSSTYIFYSIINNNDIDDLMSLINVYNGFCKTHNKIDVLLYIKCNFTNDINYISNININYPVLINFNILNTDNINIIHDRCNCFLSVNIENSYIEALDASVYNNNIIINNNSIIKEYISNAYYYDNIYEDNLSDLMSFIYKQNQKNNNINKYLNLYTINNSSKYYNIFNNETSNKKQNKQEIFMIGKLDIFKRRMDKLYYDF